MNKYQDKNKQNKLEGIMHNRQQVSFKVLEQLERDGILEDYDSFKIISEHFSDLYMFYLDGEYYLIDTDKKDFREIDNELLRCRYFVLNKCITNNIQGFIQRYGINKFYELSTKEFIDVMLMHKDSLLNTEEER